ncbi:MAG TPA: EamA family transporter [Micromonosporaceae bacterium]|jgi:DME family drug/metabolite transporter|nr:EamA family transporter [Micromonosporaceae bacterium]
MYPILLAACLWGTTGTAQALAANGVGPVSVGAARIVFGGLLLSVVASRGLGFRRLAAGGRTTWLLLALGAVCIAANQTAFFAAVSRTGVATGTVVTIGSGPAFAGLLAVLTRQGRITTRWVLATLGAVAGCVLLVAGGRAGGVEPYGVALALLAGFGYASYATVAGYLIGMGEADRAVLGALFGGAALLLLPVLLGSDPGWLLTGQGLALAGYLGVVTTTGGYLLYGRGLRTTPAAVATTLTLAEPAVAAVLGLTLLGERLDAPALSGLALLAGSLFLLLIPTPSTPTPSTPTPFIDKRWLKQR